MSSRTIQTVDPQTASLERYYAHRLKEVARIGENPGHFSLGWILSEWTGADVPGSKLLQLKIPLESTVKSPLELLPLLSGFRAPFCLELFKDKEGYLGFQIAVTDIDYNHSLTALRGLLGSQVNVKVIPVGDWNVQAGLNGGISKLLLPRSSLYPLSFALTWEQADIVTMLLEAMLTQPSTPLLLQVYVSPQVKAHLATDILAALANTGRLLEPFRTDAIRKRFSEPLLIFGLRLLGKDESSLDALGKNLSALRAPFNEFRMAKLSSSKERKLSEAILSRKQGLSDSLSVISETELAGLWHFPLKPDYNLKRQLVREVATARVESVAEMGRTLGLHTERGQTRPVVLPYSARNQHLTLFGRSQSGKTTAVLRMICGDIESGLGVAVVDTHDLPERLLLHLPRSRWDDVLLISPRLMSEGQRMFPLNLFDLPVKNAFAVEFVTESLKEMLGRAFTKEAIGPRTSYIFDIATRALLMDPGPVPHTVLDISHILLDYRARDALAERLPDEDLREKLKGFSKLPRESFAAPLNKLEAFFRPSIQNMVGVAENGFHQFRGKHQSLLDAKPIVICDLSGIPRTSAVLIGSVVMSLLQLEAFRRDLKKPHEIFQVYVDEVGAFLNLENTDLVTRTLQETAKYFMALTMISQGYDVIPENVRKSLSTNVAALMYFSMGIGSGDAWLASKELHEKFSEEELNALPVGNSAVRLGRDVFSVYSPDFPRPTVDHSSDLISHALKLHGREVVVTPVAIPNSPNIPHTAYTAEFQATAVSNDKPVKSGQDRSLKLAETNGTKRDEEILRLLLLGGLVSLQDLCAVFFPTSPAYGRQYLKKLLQADVVGTVKIGRQLLYFLQEAGLKKLKAIPSDVVRFDPSATRFHEHAALTGAVAARIYARGKETGAVFSIRREFPVGTNLRPDLAVRWEEGGLKLRLFVEADRGTESPATFIKEKVEAYACALSSDDLSPAGVTPRILVVTEDQDRTRVLAEAISTEISPELKSLFRLCDLSSWPIGTDFLKAQIWHTAESGQLASLIDFPASAVSANGGHQ